MVKFIIHQKHKARKEERKIEVKTAKGRTDEVTLALNKMLKQPTSLHKGGYITGIFRIEEEEQLA